MLMVHHHPNYKQNKTMCYSASSVAVQKLRISKWFKSEEQRILCAVIECGFIVEVRNITTKTQSNVLIQNNDSYENLSQNQEASSWYGLVLCKKTKDNKAKPETIEIYSIKVFEKGSFKLIRFCLDEIWKNGWEIRINNFNDLEKQAHGEKDIRNQISFARKAKHSFWSNNKQFVYWCRYGNRQQDLRRRQMSECVKWGSVGMNAGMLLIMNKEKSVNPCK